MRKILILITSLLMGSQSYAGVIQCVATQVSNQSVEIEFFIDYMPPASKIIFDKAIVEEVDTKELTINFSSLSIIKGKRIMAASAVAPKGYVVGVDLRFNAVAESFKNAIMKVGFRDVFGLISQPENYTVKCN